MMGENLAKKTMFTFRLFTLFCFLTGSCASAVRVRNDHRHAFVNLTSYMSFLDDVYGYLSENRFNISQKCQAETQLLLRSVQNGDANALKILDSTGKPSSGVLEGGVFFIGFYSECVKTVVNVLGDPPVHGKYCLMNLNFSAPVHQKAIPQASWLVLTQGQKPPTIGICMPSSCTANDLNLAASGSLVDNFENVRGNVSVCHGDPNGFDRDLTALMILSFLLLFVVIAIVGTICDFCCCSDETSSDQTMANVASKSISTEALCDKDSSKFNYRDVVLQVLLAFSFKRNAAKIFQVQSGGENIKALHGLRFLSMVLIILGHTFSFATQNLYFRNPGKALQAPKDFISQLFANGTLAVDTFYFISGLLVAFVTLKFLKKTDGKFPFLSFYLHRYFRLTPLMMVVILFCAFILRYVGSGPNWLFSIQMYDDWCKDNWWVNALYLHNFINTETMCLSHTWYLATDMQFYLVVPLILIPLHKDKWSGIAAMFCFLSATVVSTALITFYNHYPAIPYVNNVLPLDIVNAYYKNVYIKPYCRMGPYIVGIAVGYFILHHKELKLKKPVAASIWMGSVIMGLTVIYLMWPANQGFLPTDSEAAAYSALARSVWAVCLGWLTVACFYGYGGFINAILSWTPLVPFSRLTYCAYLIHPVVMNVYYGCTETIVDFSYSFLLYTFLGNLCATYVISIVLSLIFESPFVALEKIKFTKKSS